MPPKKWSDINFQGGRLGRTAESLDASNALYIDFTNGPDVGNTHGLFYKEANEVVRAFFTVALNGGKGEQVPGLSYDVRSNAYRFA